MTHSGGKPHVVGDRGQRYEITYFDPSKGKHMVYGWAGIKKIADKIAKGIESHPYWTDPQVRDREIEPNDQ